MRRLRYRHNKLPHRWGLEQNWFGFMLHAWLIKIYITKHDLGQAGLHTPEVGHSTTDKLELASAQYQTYACLVENYF
jgi:hypothetical protein